MGHAHDSCVCFGEWRMGTQLLGSMRCGCVCALCSLVRGRPIQKGEGSRCVRWSLADALGLYRFVMLDLWLRTGRLITFRTRARTRYACGVWLCGVWTRSADSSRMHAGVTPPLFRPRSAGWGWAPSYYLASLHCFFSERRRDLIHRTTRMTPAPPVHAVHRRTGSTSSHMRPQFRPTASHNIQRPSRGALPLTRLLVVDIPRGRR